MRTSSLQPNAHEQEVKIRLWALLQQATLGDAANANTELPGKVEVDDSAVTNLATYEMLRTMQMEEWRKYQGISSEDSMNKYIALVTECAPDWRLGWIKRVKVPSRDKASAAKGLMWILKVRSGTKRGNCKLSSSLTA